MFRWHVTSCASTRTVDCLLMPSVRQEDLIHLDIKEQLSVLRKNVNVWRTYVSSSAKSSGFNILRSVLSTFHGFCLLYVSIFQICSSLTSVGRDKEVGSVLVLSLSPASLRGFCVLLFCTVTTPTRFGLRLPVWSFAPPWRTHAGKAKDWPCGAPDQLHFIFNEH